MASLPLRRKLTDIVLLLNCGENVNFQEILEHATIEDIPLQAIDEFHLQDTHTQICKQLEHTAQECACTPENLIVQGLIKLVTKSTSLSDLEAISKAIEVALVDIKTERTA